LPVVREFATKPYFASLASFAAGLAEGDAEVCH